MLGQPKHTLSQPKYIFRLAERCAWLAQEAVS